MRPALGRHRRDPADHLATSVAHEIPVLDHRLRDLPDRGTDGSDLLEGCRGWARPREPERGQDPREKDIVAGPAIGVDTVVLLEIDPRP